MTKKSEKENDRIQISAFWLSERQSPYAFNFLKKNASTHRGEQISLIRSAITTGLVLNNLFPDLSSFINGLNERLTSADLNRFFNEEFKKNEFDNETLSEQISSILDLKFKELFSIINNCELPKTISLTDKQHDVSKASTAKRVKGQQFDLMPTELTGIPKPDALEIPTQFESTKMSDSETDTDHSSAPDSALQIDNKVHSEHVQVQSITRKKNKKANANLANLAK